MTTHATISGSNFLMKLVEAGVIGVDDHIRRVVIDAPFDRAVRLYVERYGDTRMLEVGTTLQGIEITEAEA